MRLCKDNVLRLSLLLLTAMLLQGCATRSPTPPAPAEIPPPPAALMSVEPSASWLDWSAKVRDYLQKARNEALSLRPKPPGCASTSPASAKCL